jgi:hypothetical protein
MALVDVARGQLLADPRVARQLTAAEVDGLLDPVAYTGLSERIATDTARRARQAARDARG